jgi:signal transduction histidine kinase
MSRAREDTPARPGRPFPLSWRYWPLVVNGAIAFALLTIGPQHIWGHSDHWWRVLLLLGLVTPLFFRRRLPLTAFAVTAAVAFIQWLTTQPAAADAALLVALYSVATSSPRRHVIIAGLTVELGVVLAVLRFTPANGAHILAFVFLSGLVTAAGVLGLTMRVRRAYLQEVEERAARLEFEHDQQAQLAVAAERTRVAREMHDILAHNLAVMIALTDGAALTLGADPQRAATALAEASRTGRVALTDLRRVLGVLREADGPTGLAPAPGLADLEPLLASVRQTGVSVRYQITGSTSQFEPGLELNAYRIIQEALTNTLKHAEGASAVDVSLRASDDGLEVLIRDDGRATPPKSPARSDGHGIVGMRERAAVHFGDVRAGRTASGWLVRAWLPTRQVAEQLVTGVPA